MHVSSVLFIIPTAAAVAISVIIPVALNRRCAPLPPVAFPAVSAYLSTDDCPIVPVAGNVSYLSFLVVRDITSSCFLLTAAACKVSCILHLQVETLMLAGSSRD